MLERSDGNKVRPMKYIKASDGSLINTRYIMRIEGPDTRATAIMEDGTSHVLMKSGSWQHLHQATIIPGSGRLISVRRVKGEGVDGVLGQELDIVAWRVYDQGLGVSYARPVTTVWPATDCKYYRALLRPDGKCIESSTERSILTRKTLLRWRIEC
jgi:hypothetical protein